MCEQLGDSWVDLHLAYGVPCCLQRLQQHKLDRALAEVADFEAVMLSAVEAEAAEQVGFA